MTNKRKLLSVLLLVIVFLASIYSYSSYQDKDIMRVRGTIEFLFVLVTYMIIPSVWRLINKKQFNIEKGKCICSWNSFILLLINFYIIGKYEIGYGGFVGAFAFYFINSWAFINDGKKVKNKKKDMKVIDYKSILKNPLLYVIGVFIVILLIIPSLQYRYEKQQLKYLIGTWESHYYNEPNDDINIINNIDYLDEDRIIIFDENLNFIVTYKGYVYSATGELKKTSERTEEGSVFDLDIRYDGKELTIFYKDSSTWVGTFEKSKD